MVHVFRDSQTLWSTLVYLLKLRRTRSSPPRRMTATLCVMALMTSIWLVVALATWTVTPLWVAALVGSLALWLTLKASRLAARRLFHMPNYDCGHARKLQGDCLVFESFWGSDWQPEEQARAAASLRIACRWLEERAADFGEQVRFVHPESCLPLSLGPAPPAYSDDWTSIPQRHAMRDALIAASADEVAARALAARASRPDNAFVVVHVRQADEGMSYATINRLWDPLDFDFCICSMNHPATYAHEILHAFGARDLYLDLAYWSAGLHMLEEDEDRAAFEDFMYRTFQEPFGGRLMASIQNESLQELSIASVTAHAIGWDQPASQRTREVIAFERCQRATGDELVRIGTERAIGRNRS